MAVKAMRLPVEAIAAPLVVSTGVTTGVAASVGTAVSVKVVGAPVGVKDVGAPVGLNVGTPVGPAVGLLVGAELVVGEKVIIVPPDLLAEVGAEVVDVIGEIPISSEGVAVGVWDGVMVKMIWREVAVGDIVSNVTEGAGV